MSVTEGQLQQQHQGGVDARALANAFTQSLKESGLVVTQQGSQPENKNEFQQALKEMVSADASPEAIGNLERLFAAHEKATSANVKKELSEQFGTVLQQERWSQAVSVAKAAIDTYLGDKADQDDKDITLERVLREFSSKHQEAARAYVTQGIKDDGLIKKIALEQSNKLNKALGNDKRGAKGPSGMDAGQVPDGKLPSAGEDGDFTSEDPGDLKGRERELYNAKISTAQRAGMRPDSKEAKEFALSGVRKFREGKRRAVEQLGSRRYHKD